MIDIRFKALAIALAFLLAIFAPGAARAQSCVVSAPAMDFGTVASDGSAAYASTALTMFCNGTPNTALRICPYIGTGTYPAPASGPRQMASGSNFVNFDLFESSAFSKRFVNGQIAGGNTDYVVALNSSGSATPFIPVYGRIPVGATTGAPGNPYSSFFSSETLIVYGYTATFSSCGSSSGRQAATFSFVVQANIQPTCSVTTSAVAFGSRSSLAAQVDATGTVTVTCGSGTSYTVALDGGANGGTSAITRKMASGANRITYGLFRDAARTAGWYSDASSVASGTGNGSAQVLTVYGRVGGQPTPAPGTYSDSVVVTVSY